MNIETEILSIVVEVSGDRNIDLSSKLIGVESEIDSLSIIEILVKIQNFAKENSLVFEWNMDNVVIDGEKPFLYVKDLIFNFRLQNNL
jgi:acyl carrier protein